MNAPPLDKRYPVTVAIVLLALSPNIVVTTLVDLIMPQLATDLHASRGVFQLSAAMSNAGYAFGAVVAADLFARFDPRKLFLFCQSAFVVGALLSAFAPDAPLFVAGRVLQGLSTGWMLVVAVPPLVNNYPPERMPSTAATFLIGFFGAATVGPLLGAGVAALHVWRIFFGVLALLGAVNLVLIRLAVRSEPPKQPDLKLDLAALVLSAAATVCSFYGVWLLETIAPTAPLGWSLVAVGGVALAALLVTEYRAKEPLVPVKPLSTSMPLLGVVCAMISGGAFVALLELVQTFLVQGRQMPGPSAGIAFWPQVVAVAVAGTAFARLFTTRYIPLLALGGMLALVAAGALVATRPLLPGSPAIGAIAALLGLGAGLTVSPGLVLASFSVPSKQIGRTFALVELLRSSAAYLLGPVLLAFAERAGRVSDGASAAPAAMLASVHACAWVVSGVTAVGIAGIVALFFGAHVPLRAPDLCAWLIDGKQAVESPPVPAPVT